MKGTIIDRGFLCTMWGGYRRCIFVCACVYCCEPHAATMTLCIPPAVLQTAVYCRVHNLPTIGQQLHARVYENRHQVLHHRNVERKGVLISVVSCG